ncbi:hypothetical protein A5656_29835 [Mycobacterium gordonae]|nr:hypothetical protein A5656_29835 [Mycobacterium gordonae]
MCECPSGLARKLVWRLPFPLTELAYSMVWALEFRLRLGLELLDCISLLAFAESLNVGRTGMSFTHLARDRGRKGG